MLGLELVKNKFLHSTVAALVWNNIVYHGAVSCREGNEKSYQLLRDSLDLYLTINPDNVQYLLLQARLYFHLGIWPEKVSMISQDGTSWTQVHVIGPYAFTLALIMLKEAAHLEFILLGNPFL